MFFSHPPIHSFVSTSPTQQPLRLGKAAWRPGTKSTPAPNISRPIPPVPTYRTAEPLTVHGLAGGPHGRPLLPQLLGKLLGVELLLLVEACRRVGGRWFLFRLGEAGEGSLGTLKSWGL